ncbi:hypothetical protein BJV74DRAFT_315821 [Russula compacta]|nr:hypothetical protein BJV74DRAFT_315821 [Russula compacta]
MPTTRSTRNAKESSSKADDSLGALAEESGSPLSDVREPNDDLQSHLSALKCGIQNLNNTQEDLLRKNRQLQQEIDRLHNQADLPIQPSPVKSGRKSNLSLHVKVKELELEIRQLKKAHAHDRKKIRQLRLKQVRQDAEELREEQLHGIPDVEHKMKKLLRHFHQVISSPSLGEEEECPICAEVLELNECSSLPCQHIFCDSCLSKMSDGENISCPQCRRPCDIESFQHVEFTATQQWDELLEIAQQFAEMEGQLGPDTSEEEEEEALRENFIDDGDAEASTTSQEHNRTSDGVQGEDIEGDDTEPEHVPYSESGVVEKRKRMTQLVAQRDKRMRLRR